MVGVAEAAAGGSTARGPAISFARDRRGVRQAASVWFRGVSYPGEVIVANTWDPAWGERLEDRAMFRIVLLTHGRRISRHALLDDRVAVAVPGERTPAAADLARQASELREAIARYSVAGDAELSSLSRAMLDRSADTERELTLRLREAWSRGALIGGGADAPRIDRELAFYGDEAAAWIDAIASACLLNRYDRTLLPAGRVHERLLPEDLEAAYAWCVATRDRPPAPRSAFALGLVSEPDAPDIDADRCPALAMIDMALALGGGVADAAELRRALVHDGGLPPDVASIFLVAHVVARDSEIRMRRPDGAGRAGIPSVPRLIRDELEAYRWSPRLVSEIAELRSKVSAEWDTALPYLRLVLPGARPAAGARDQQAQFDAALRPLQAELAETFELLERLEETLGASGRVADAQRDLLSVVLGSVSWQEYFANARAKFGSVALLARSLSVMRGSRRLTARAAEIELCARYLDEAGVAPGDTRLQLMARWIRSQMELPELMENPDLWPPILQRFDLWRADYRHAYLADHARRQDSDRAMARRIERTGRQVRALEGFARIPELGPPPDVQAPARWREVSRALQPCPRAPDQVSLATRPYCDACRVLPGALPAYADIEAVMMDIERALREYNRRLSSVTIRNVLSDRKPRETDRLMKLRDAADLSALGGMLDAEVIGFLRRYLQYRGATTP